MARKNDSQWFPLFIATMIPIALVLLMSLFVYPQSVLKNWAFGGIGIAFLFFVLARAKDSSSWDLYFTWIICGLILVAYIVHDCFMLV